MGSGIWGVGNISVNTNNIKDPCKVVINNMKCHYCYQTLKPLTWTIASVLRPSASKRYFPECSSLHLTMTNLWIAPSLVIRKLSPESI